MIVHVVLFEPRPDLSSGDRERIFDDLRAAAAAIPTLRRCRLGRRVTHGLPGYEQAMRDMYSYAALFEFDDLDGLRAYLQHPCHRAIGSHFGQAALRALAYDYAMTDVGDG